MPYDTMNPVPSTDPRDLYDNAGITDKYVNGQEPFVPDRLGVQRRTWKGMEVDFNNAQEGRESAFDQFLEASAFIWIGDYGAGLTFTSRSQYMVRDGMAYRLANSTTVPYTSTGNWAQEQTKFDLVNSDSILRQDLAESMGAQNVGGAQVTVSSFAGLRALATNKASTWAVISTSRFLSFYRLDLADSTTVDDGGSVIAPNNGPGRWKLNYSSSILVDQFGSQPTTGFDNSSMLQKAVAFAWANKVELRGGRGTYEYSTTLDLSYPTLVFRGCGFRNTVFKFTGTGRAMDAIGTRPNNGIYSFDLDLSDFTIEGNPNTTDLLRVRINHARIVRINLREASTTTGCGLRIGGCVAGHFEQITMSTNTQLMTSRPATGIVIEADPTLNGARATCNSLISPCIEGATGDGIVLLGCDQLTVIGGTSENNGGNGLTEMAGSQMNTYIGFDCEVNLGFADIFIGGQSSQLINCGSTKYTYVDNSARFTKIEGGWFDKVEVGVGAVGVELSKIKTRFFGGPVGLVTNNNPFLSTKDIFDVATNAVVFFSKPAAVIPLTGTGMTYTNNNTVNETILIHLNGGAITQIVYRRAGDAVGNINPNTGVVMLQPGDGLTFTYTGSPIFTRAPNGTNHQ